MSNNNIVYHMKHYRSLVRKYEENKDNNWEDWLEHESLFPYQGKHGYTGIMRIKSNEQEKIVYKISQYINDTINQEYTVLESLNSLSEYCPHFCKMIGKFACNVNTNVKTDKSPFRKCKYPIKKDVLLLEYIKGSNKLVSYIQKRKYNEDILYSCIKQTLLGINIAQRKKKFTHYDLHSENILLRKCNKNIVFLYILSNNTQYAVYTHGYYPVIIDFGFSYVDNMEDDVLWASMGFTNSGITSNQYDKINDSKLFLTTVSDEIYTVRKKSEKSAILRDIVTTIFKPLSIDWNTGWDNHDKLSASDYVLSIIKKNYTPSKLFTEYEHYTVDAMQTLIILPFEPQNYDNLSVSYNTIITEFYKIEKEIGQPFYSLYIFKSIINSARCLRSYYIDKNTRESTVKMFKDDITRIVDEVCKYVFLKDVNYEKLLVSLYVFSRSMEGVLYKFLQKDNERKAKEYYQMPVKNVDDIYNVIEDNIQDNYVYSEDTIIVAFDCIREKKEVFKILNKDIINQLSLKGISKSKILYKLYQTNFGI